MAIQSTDLSNSAITSFERGSYTPPYCKVQNPSILSSCRSLEIPPNSSSSSLFSYLYSLFSWITELLFSKNGHLLSPEEREHRIRGDEADIQARLNREYLRAQKEMACEPIKPFHYMSVDPVSFPHHEITVGKYHVGICHAQGRRKTMEDEHLATQFILKIGDKAYPIQLFGVFDGHGGPTASRFVRDHLQSYLEKALSDHNPNDLTSNGIWNALKLAFVRLNEGYKAQYGSYEKIYPHGRKIVADEEGTTAVVAMIIDGNLWIANVGDSRAMLENGTPIQLSRDARAGDPNFQPGIYHRGGEVIQCDIPRLGGDLAIARSIGDFRLKGANSARPKLIVLPLSQIKKGSRLLLVCDGITDVASTTTLLKAVRDHKLHSPGTSVSNIVGSAWKAGSGDNLTACLIEM
jgi:protein phosphatase 1L